MSSYEDLLGYLSTIEKAPIEIQSIVDWLESNGFQDKINIYPVDIDYKIVSALIVRRKELGIPYADAKKITSIYYSKHHNECWARLLVCKELMHFFDYENNAAADDEAKINNLISELIDWKSFNKTVTEATTEADIMALTRALLCLAPAHIIDELQENDALSKKTIREIAYFLKIPMVMIEKVFSEKFLTTHTSAKYGTPLSIVE